MPAATRRRPDELVLQSPEPEDIGPVAPASGERPEPEAPIILVAPEIDDLPPAAAVAALDGEPIPPESSPPSPVGRAGVPREDDVWTGAGPPGAGLPPPREPFDIYSLPGLERFRGQGLRAPSVLEEVLGQLPSSTIGARDPYTGPDVTKIPILGQLLRLAGAPVTGEEMAGRPFPAFPLGARTTEQRAAAQELTGYQPGMTNEQLAGLVLMNLPLPSGIKALSPIAREVAEEAAANAARAAARAAERAVERIPEGTILAPEPAYAMTHDPMDVPKTITVVPSRDAARRAEGYHTLYDSRQGVTFGTASRDTAVLQARADAENLRLHEAEQARLALIAKRDAARPTVTTPRAARPRPSLAEESPEAAQLREYEAIRYKSASDEIMIDLLKKRIAADPSKWKVGDGVGWKVTGRQINRGFRIVEVYPDTKQAKIRSVADTGLTTSGGDTDRIGDEVVHIADLVRDNRYTAKVLPPRETIIPADDVVLGENTAGETLYERSGTGERYRIRFDRADRPNGYPDFGGDLVVADEALSGAKPLDVPTPAPIVYHGSQNIFEKFDPGRANGDALYGPGIYFTESPDVAGGYARTRRGTEGAGNIRPVSISVSKPFNVDAPVDRTLLESFNGLSENELADAEDAIKRPIDNIATNKELYKALLGAFGNKSEVNDWLGENGYDAITYIGGRRTGQAPHRVWIVLDDGLTDINERIAPKLPSSEAAAPSSPPVVRPPETPRLEEAPFAARGAIQSGMGIGEAPPQGSMFENLRGEGYRPPLVKVDALGSSAQPTSPSQLTAADEAALRAGTPRPRLEEPPTAEVSPPAPAAALPEAPAPASRSPIAVAKAASTPEDGLADGIRAAVEAEGLPSPTDPPALAASGPRRARKLPAAPNGPKGPPRTPRAPTGGAGGGGKKPPRQPGQTPPNDGDPDGALAALTNIIPEESAARAAVRKYDGAHQIEALQIQEWWEQGNKLLKSKGLGRTMQGRQVLSREQGEGLLRAMHGEGPVPEGLQDVFDDLKAIGAREQADMLADDPAFARAAIKSHPDYFPRMWRDPRETRLGTRQMGGTPGFKKPRVDATFSEMLDDGWDPLSWNPYDLLAMRRIAGHHYRQQKILISKLKSTDQVMKAADAPRTGWRVPEVGPAFEGRPYIDPDGKVAFTGRWAATNRVANQLEEMYGKPGLRMEVEVKLPASLGGERTIDVWKGLRHFANTAKRMKLVASLFQHIDFATRAGAAATAATPDNPMALLRYPSLLGHLVETGFLPKYGPARRKVLRAEILSGTPLSANSDISYRMIGEEGWNLGGDTSMLGRDITDFLRDVGKNPPEGLRVLPAAVGRRTDDFSRFFESGLFEGVYRESQAWALKHFIVPRLRALHPTWNSRQIAGSAAEEVNKMFSTLGTWQSWLQQPEARELARAIMFSPNETESWIRQSASVVKGQNANLWRRYALGYFFFLAGVGNAINYAMSGEPLDTDAYMPVVTDSPYAPFGGVAYNDKFLAPKIPGAGRNGGDIYVDLVGQADTPLRWILDPAGAFGSRLNIFPRAGWNQAVGEDFWGRKLESWQQRAGQLAFDVAAPIGAGNLAEAARQAYPESPFAALPEQEGRIGVTGNILQGLGFNLRGEKTPQLLDRRARESGFTKADGSPVTKASELEPWQRKQLDSADTPFNRELKRRGEIQEERGDERAPAFAALKRIDADRIEQEEALIDEWLAEGHSGMSGQKLRERAVAIQGEAAVQKARIDDVFKLFKDTGKLPDDSNDRALTQYYNAWDAARTGSGRLDFDRVNELLAALEEEWTDEQSAYVERNSGLTEHGPKFQEFQEAKKTVVSEYYDLPAGEARNAWRYENPEKEAVLVKWGYLEKSINDLKVKPKYVPSGSAAGTPAGAPTPKPADVPKAGPTPTLGGASGVYESLAQRYAGATYESLTSAQETAIRAYFDRLDAEAKSRYGKGYRSLSVEQQEEIQGAVGAPSLPALRR